MSTRNDQFNEKMLSLDAFLSSFEDESKIAALSDKGAGAKKIRNYDNDNELENLEINKLQQKKLKEAVDKLTSANKKHLIPVLLQIAKNGKNRKESFWRLSRIWKRKLSGTRREYYRVVNELLMFFSPNKNRGETHF